MRRRARRREERRERVLDVFNDPHPHYGLEIMRRAHVRALHLYPILDDLLEEQLIRSGWDDASGRRTYQWNLTIPPGTLTHAYEETP